MSEPTRWRAFFSDYRDTSQGLLLDKNKDVLNGYSNMASDFEVVNAANYDQLKAERDRLRAALTKIVQHLDSANGLSTDMSILSIAREALGEK